ncbi:MAG TPA: 3-oxoacyl-ACP reductase family protein [Dehalococcoidia bacterium]|nr:3-oxoacyl-ACP reductase family protein [Dehalococcoidia bacterium]
MGSLKDKVAIVTGASRGLGKAIAAEFAKEGAKVAVNYYQSKEPAEALVAEIKSAGGEAIAVHAGVAHPDECAALVETTVNEFGGLDILVNNAGVNRDRTIRRMTAEEWREVIATDLDSVFYCTAAAVPHMIERGGGRIVNMASIIGQMGNLGQSNYAAAKAGIVGFSKSAAQELARFNITVNALCPGFIETDMVMNLTDEVKEALLAKIPLGRFGKPEEVAQITRFLCTEGGYVTGAQININGGMYMQ